MQVKFYLAGEITQVMDSIPWVRCASGNVLFMTEKVPMMIFGGCNDNYDADNDDNDDKNEQKPYK